MAVKNQLLGELMKEAQEGSSASYETLLAEVYMFLESYLSTKIYNKSQVDDVIQEVILAVHNSRHTFDVSKSFMSWLLAITYYKVSDHLRYQFKQKTQELDETILDEGADAVALLIENQNMQLLHRAIEDLEQKPRQVIKLLKIEGLKISEVAKKLNLSESNVKVIAHRAYQGLEVTLRSKL